MPLVDNYSLGMLITKRMENALLALLLHAITDIVYFFHARDPL